MIAGKIEEESAEEENLHHQVRILVLILYELLIRFIE
jgi:hypothetical protein